MDTFMKGFSQLLLFCPDLVMEDWQYGLMSNNSEGGGRRSMRNEDFEEEDVWSFVKESEEEEEEDSSPKRNSNEYSFGSSSSSSAWRFTTAPIMIPRSNNNNMPITAHDEAANKVGQQSSAPMNIPDWSKIYGKNANLGSSRNGSRVDTGISFNDVGNDDDDDDNEDMLPPHEWLARKLARNKISSFSVCEGIGRRLKGRDLSKVRNTILTKTGFLE
ncbi:hypothetical protein Patl1_10018 [Pistacia atlantica]|uniref:Uncharacterized protein n=1 Tax=Pistacia atlantica TaxID=434234 RepID=A0ACC1A6Q6_9ROSI|nr:hypothetical protein Patl1_10018 [Pistacia atlantica]